MFSSHTTPTAAFTELFSGIESFLPKRLDANLEPEARWLEHGSPLLGQYYGNLLRYNLRLEKSGGDIKDAFPQAYPRAAEVERLLQLSEEKGRLPKTHELLRSLERIVQSAENTTHDILEEQDHRIFKAPAPPLGPWEEIAARLDDALYGGTVEAGESVYSVSEIEDLILSLLYLRHHLFKEPLPVVEVETQLRKLRFSLVDRLRGIPSASARFLGWLESYWCVGYLDADPLSGSFWTSILGND